MTTLTGLEADARAVSLAVRGAFHPGPNDAADGAGTLLMLGPDEPDFWSVFTASPEYGDGARHPLDRWSKRVVGGLAERWGGRAVYPYDGPPYAPFIRWAAATKRTHASPVGLLVHDEAGLFASFRGAILIPQRVDLPPPSESPCPTCSDKPCETACPVGAMAPGKGYDVPACHAHVLSEAGRSCREEGCLVRRTCPVSKRFGRLPEQSAFHMAAFVGQ